MTDTTLPSSEQSPPSGPTGGWPGPPPTRPHSENRFFAWMRDRGIPRRGGWIGGVCAGLAARMGVDPLIVRGIFVVAAVLGFPALFIYVAAWALMPDEEGRIQLEQLFRGRFDPAMIAIGIGLLLSLVPAGPWILSLFASSNGFYYGDGYGFAFPVGGLGSGIGIAITLILMGVVTWMIVWAVRSSRSQRAFATPMDTSAPSSGSVAGMGAATDPWAASTPGPWVAATGTTAPDAEASTPGAAPDFAYAPAPTAEAVIDLDPPIAPGPEAHMTPPIATDAEQWREQQRAWREQHDAWRRQQADADRVVRDQLRAERVAANAAFATESSRRRAERRAANPRASGAFVLSVIGACLVLGAGVGLFTANTASSSELAALAPAIGLLVAATIAALGMIIAGAFRRRSGFLAFLTAILLVFGLAAPALTDDRVILLGDRYIGGTSSTEFVQPWGTLQIELRDTVHLPPGDTISVVKGSGWTYVIVYPGVALDLRANVGNVELITQRGSWLNGGELTTEHERVRAGAGTLHPLNRTFTTLTPQGTAVAPRTVTLNLQQLSGEVTIMVVDPEPAPAMSTEEGAP